MSIGIDSNRHVRTHRHPPSSRRTISPLQPAPASAQSANSAALDRADRQLLVPAGNAGRHRVHRGGRCDRRAETGLRPYKHPVRDRWRADRGPRPDGLGTACEAGGWHLAALLGIGLRPAARPGAAARRGGVARRSGRLCARWQPLAAGWPEGTGPDGGRPSGQRLRQVRRHEPDHDHAAAARRHAATQSAAVPGRGPVLHLAAG